MQRSVNSLSGSLIQANLLTRLNQIPGTKSTTRIIFLLSLVWLAEAFDIGVVGPVLSILTKSWHLTASQTGILAVASTLGVVIGMIPSGVLADKIGRRKVVLWGILFFSVLTVIGATVHNVGQLAAIRFFAGIGEGAVLPMPYLFLSEFVHGRQRAQSVGYANGVLTAAYVIPNLASLWALHSFSGSLAWRFPFLMGGIPLLTLLPLYLWLPESPRYLLKVGKTDEVQELVEHLEDEAGLSHDATLVDKSISVSLRALPERGAKALRTMFHKPYLGRSVMVTMQLTAALMLFYILQVFGPTLLLNRGSNIGSAILLSGLMMLIGGIGSIVQGHLSDKFGRKRVLTLYVILASAGCILFTVSDLPTVTLLSSLLTSWFGLGIFPVTKLCVAEQYPTELRGRGVYMDEMTARTLSGVATTYFVPFFVGSYGNHVVFIGVAVILVVFSLPFLLLGRETAGIPMEEAGMEGSAKVQSA
ncbi:MFS transporter [Alicyclobacillus tolerans]|uniref:MFS transporter n=1 Tax=Alicyclobacillus tolerans TaxID=90970 RepID=UPI001F40412C|nr:MFS transporter [Alicyclobacillus tolerans]MCF8565911.1 MFS transporter [Alicyclobacillus tolerans]